MTTMTAPLSEETRRLGDSHWPRFVLRRSGRLVVSLWVLLTASFLMIHALPGDPVRGALGPTASAELVAQRREQLGLDDPLLLQYWNYLAGVLTGRLGVSFGSNLPVAQVIADRLPATASLALLAFAVAIAVAIPVGVVVAVRTRRGRGRGLELGFASGSVFLSAIPDFLIGVALVWVFGVTLGWFPIAGRSGPDSYVLPVLALAIGPAAVLARIVRVEMLNVLDADFIRTARAKRLPAWRIHLNHALPNAVTATLTLAGLLLASLVVGTVLVENVFAWPGLGSTIVQAILTKDYPLAQGVVLVYGVGVLVINTIVDAALLVLDPRTAAED
ncbi:ABC transporter permease [Microbacterium sp. NPDC019599]|uniref:ABC transporter permease n=1 Tax=Microbacterium sp. NPDC019599 TaxID=3154690 RepID=UPI00340F9CDE